MKIISLGINLDEDFGHPSLVHGLFNLLKMQYGSDLEFIHFQFDKLKKDVAGDFEFPIVSVNCSYKKLFIYYYKYKMHLSIPKDVKYFFDTIKKCDYVVDPFGIRFCDKFTQYKKLPLMFYRYILSEFCPFVICKKMHKKIVKTQCSFGPINNKQTKRVAKYMSKKIYGRIFAREIESKQFIENVLKRNDIQVFPDMANAFDVQLKEKANNLVGISISFQVERQFKTQSYIETMTNICTYLYEKCGKQIRLIPNQTLKNGRDDCLVAKDIFIELQKSNIPCEIVDIKTLTSTQVKQSICECQFVIASRYHSCVAALSSGTPVISFGWHHKYLNLLRLYGIEQYVYDVSDFNLKDFLDTIDEVISSFDSIQKTVQANAKTVRELVIESSKEFFNEY